MRKTTNIEPHSGNVSIFRGPDKGWIPSGRLMPEVTNVIPEQPKSLAQKLVEARSKPDQNQIRRTMFHAK